MKKDNNEIRKQNIKIYSLYRMLSVDHIFYYAIEFMFLTQVKKITAADIVFGAAVYSFFRMTLQIPIVVIVDKLGNKKSTVIANIFIAIFVLLILNCRNIGILIVAQLFDAIGFSLKEASDTTLLNKSIPDSSKKGEIFSKIEGKGIKNYYFFTAITSIIAGILYGVNPYIPIIISFCISLIATIISLGFGEIELEEKSLKKIDLKTYLKDLKRTFKFIIKSNRLKSLILYCGIMWGVINLTATFITSLLEEIGAIALVIAIISAIREIFSGIGAEKQVEFNEKYKNKSLARILIIHIICIILLGLIGKLSLNIYISVIIITSLAILINYLRGIYDVLTTRYLQNFTTPKIVSKIYAMNSISRNFFRIIISLFGSFLLRKTNTANSSIIFGTILIVISTILILYMKPRLGLRPEEYKTEDIKFK